VDVGYRIWKGGSLKRSGLRVLKIAARELLGVTEVYWVYRKWHVRRVAHPPASRRFYILLRKGDRIYKLWIFFRA